MLMLILMQGKAVLKDGIGRATEVEEPVDPTKARTFLANPNALLQHDSKIIDDLKAQTGVQELVCLGGFKNTRNVYAWEGQVLELDETCYEWGTLYELECETSEPMALRDKLGAFLKDAGVQYSYSTTTKFANFIRRTLE